MVFFITKAKIEYHEKSTATETKTKNLKNAADEIKSNCVTKKPVSTIKCTYMYNFA